MGLAEYIGKAAAAWFMGFFPFFEIYVAVPASIALGLDYFSAVFWPVLGNFTPVPLIVFAHNQLMRIERVKRWLTGRTSERFERWLNRYGSWVILIVTPWVGIWVVAATARALGMRSGPLLLYSFISILAYAVLIAAGIALGIDFLTG
ncbi:hypothetical protein E0L93_02910 [Rubrobacter taiwanensis]|uniref:Small multi-drug export protein n=1 Tax=Rubrobacter taiwanensis TaxID=185139 RepID=A0A4R1BQF6_9ACTN|nr:small multi-drug export protein [Rubrobacter taiwanensis]TCJ19920.1 hypothetical protein E0L93_02910 [Rubrobacter taiwanensis]